MSYLIEHAIATRWKIKTWVSLSKYMSYLCGLWM